MGQKEVTFQNYLEGRKKLGESLPMDMPYTFGIHVTNLCNFKCFYCVTSEKVEERIKNKIVLKSIDLDTYKKCIDSLCAAGHLKVLFLAGWGEPLLHPDIVEMVDYAKKKNVADLVRIYTNGSLLTHALSDGLIAAGLDNLKVSLQGLCAEDYKRISDVEIDYNELRENIQYFYEHKKNTVLTVKIMDIMVKEKGQREEFIRQYQDICDEYMVDTLTEKVKDIDYTNKGSDFKHCYLCGEQSDTEICSVPFFRAYADVDAQMFPCPAIPTPKKFGDITEGFKRVWQGEDYTRFLIDLLSGRRNQMPICRECKEYHGLIVPTEVLDEYASKLIPAYESRLKK